MKLIRVAAILTSLSTVVSSNCSDFEKEWKVCSDDMYPSGPIDNIYCSYNIHTFTKVVIIHDVNKRSSVYCQNETFPDAIFDCIPLNNTRRFILTDCPFRQNLFDKFFQNSSLDELLVRNKNSDILYPSIHLHHLPRFRFLSLINIRTPPYFNLSLNSLPYLISIKISNFTFNGLPPKPFEKLPKLKGLSITNGTLESLPDGFLDLSDRDKLVKLELSSNKLKNFQPPSLRNMKTLKKLNLAHNFLESVDENLFMDTHALEEVTFSYNRINSLPSRLFRTTPAIKVLLLDHNALSEIPEDIFQGLHLLSSLKLSHNRLSFLPPNVLNDTTSLTILQLQSNQLHTVPTNALPSLGALREIDLSDNKINKFSSSTPFGYSKYLTKINMSSNYLLEFTTVSWDLYKFEQLDLSNNHITELTIPISRRSEGGGEIFLRNNKIRTVKVTTTSFDHRYFLSGNPFDCSCDFNTTFFSSLEVVGDVDNLTCEEPWYMAGERITDFQIKTELCGMGNDCPSSYEFSLLLFLTAMFKWIVEVQ